VQVVLTLAQSGQPLVRTLLADTGAGSHQGSFELILDEVDCLLGGGAPGQLITLTGAYPGAFRLYDLPVSLPALGFSQDMRVVGMASPMASFDGIACFGFLNRFTYGNFGNPNHFGLEC
jgi:hypothetical protein